MPEFSRNLLKKRYAGRINKTLDVFEQEGFSAPSEEFYSTLEKRLMSEKNYKPSTLNDMINLAKDFFAFVMAGQGLAKTENITSAPAGKNTGRKAGRPSKTDALTGESYSEKATVYLTPTEKKDVDLIAESKGLTLNDYIRAMLIADRDTCIEQIREAQEAKALYEQAKAKLGALYR